MNISKNPNYRNRKRNEDFRDLLTENYKLLAIIALTLNKHFPKDFYPKKLINWYDTLTETAELLNRSDREGTFEYDIDNLTDQANVNLTFEDCVSITKFQLLKSTGAKSNAFAKDKNILEVLARNVQGAILQTHYDFGFGSKRIAKLIHALKTDWYMDPVQQLSDLGIEASFELSDSDADKFFKHPKIHVDMEEIKEIRRGLDALKAYQDDIMNML